MGGIIDFSTDCPWQLYLFSFLHLFAGLFMYFIDVSKFMTLAGTPSTETESLMQRVLALSMLYVGVLFTAITYHNKRSAANITTFSNVALSCATAFLASCVFTGNASLGGIEKSWMHIGDMLTMAILVAILFCRVTQQGAEWAEKKAIGEGLGINCKTLLLFFLPITILKFFAYTDFIDPKIILADGLEMTELAHWMWTLVAVLIFECAMALSYTVFFDDSEGHEVVVATMAAMTLLAGCSVYSVQGYMSSWMGMNGSGLWIKIAVMIGVCIAAVVGGRMGGHRAGYSNV
ncbi:hypothetical protein HJC23_004919 [Cyclotella cryptica]|uniref:Uncharacterized protein n=1 Tax=Cyclotella cryptica TaxID=29204 RepID=A0ABD3PSU4_9STRA|eukprot:CCRYP_011867-RA/>CCRYP_011867-RA protein AED:0.25 eAED:0.25 QI:211/1/1/1/0/0.5/2/101/289